MRLVIVESPYRGPSKHHIDANVAYARKAVADAIAHGEAPFASHLLYTQPGILRDNVKEERLKGIVCGYQWMMKADAVLFYIDLGMSSGMKAAEERAKALGMVIEYRQILLPESDL